jgi:YD repeat-containing protein
VQRIDPTSQQEANPTAITCPRENLTPEGSRLQTTFTYNPVGQPLTVTDPLGHTTTFEYDSVGNLTATIDPLGHRTERNYDTPGWSPPKTPRGR